MIITNFSNKDWSVAFVFRAHTLYDRPPSRFHEMDISTQHKVSHTDTGPRVYNKLY